MSAMLVLLLFLAVTNLDFTAAQIGVAYGINGDNLPPPSRVVELYKQYCIQRMRIYEPQESILEALRGSNIELTMSILNPNLSTIAASQANADAWVAKHITNYTPGVLIKNVVVGNEISPTSENHQFVLPAMQNIINAICSAGLDGHIKVTTSIATNITEGYPPEEGKFKDDVCPYIAPIINLVVSKGAPLFASLFPYFAYVRDPKHIDLGYALLDPTHPGVPTPYNHTYQNLYYAQYDTVYAAVERIIASSPEMTDIIYKPVVGGGETGHPKKSKKKPHKKGAEVDEEDDVANVENARIYVNNLVRVVKSGTPLRPGRPIQTFIFAMFDENLKEGDEEERHFGLFHPDGTPFFPVNFN